MANHFLHRVFVFFCLGFASRTASQSAIPPVGEWRDHLNYQTTIQVLKGDRIYCATATHVFAIDEAGEAERFTKVNGLNDFGVRCIGWDASTQQLLIAYNNSNLDVLKNGSVKNIGDIRRSTIAGNKTINAIFCRDGSAYLSGGLGVIVVNLNRYEISDTWFIGNNGGQLVVNGFYADGSFYYAATEEGLKRAPVTANPSNYASWQNLSGLNGLPAGSVTNVLSAFNKVIAQKTDSLYVFNGVSWSLLYADAAWPVISVTSSENKLLVCQRTAAGNSRVITLTENGSIEKNISQPGVISLPRSAIGENGKIWVADQFGGLSAFSNSVERFIPNGPPGTANGEIIFHDDTLFAAAGSVSNAWNYLFDRNGIYDFRNDTWHATGNLNYTVPDSVLDFITITTDPRDGSVWAGSYGGGLVNFRNGASPVIYKQRNSTLQAATGDAGSYRVSGLAFDQQQNLWISNYGAPQDLQVLKSDGTWKAFNIPFVHTENAVSQIVIDDLDQLWIVSPKDNGLFCYNHGASIDNTNDDHWKFFRQGAGNGNLPGNNVLCIAKDKNGFIWVGTDKGIGIIRCISEVFAGQGCEATLPVVQQDRFTGLLFRDETVQTIAVDGANRKWVGTKNGVWLISPDGEKIIYRFTAENSPLPDNDIRRIAVNPVSGEVFIATFNGICSFRGTATEGNSSFNNVLVFPNPVPPGYNGTIAIRGLKEQALVKITELSGRLVFQGRALGGQFVWNGLNYNGTRMASGVYLVLVRDDAGVERIATKVVIVH